MTESTSFGQWLKQRRKALDMTQEALADRVSCSKVTIRKIEGNELRPSRQIAERLALALGIAAEEQANFVQFARTAGGNWQPAPIRNQLESAPWRPQPAGSRLPAPLTGVIGREREVAAGCALLRRPNVRLVTLSGPPGIGKTRLSLQTAAVLAADFDEEVYFVPLASIFDAQLVLPAIAQEVGVRESANQSLMAGLRERFRGKPTLLVLDNFEQVTAAAPVVSELLTTIPSLKVLVTSRELLHIYGEQEFPVPPLTLPDLRNLPPVEALSLYPAIALFVQRAQAARFDFALTAGNAAAVAGICAWLDGLPLAIEMAAARVKWLAPAVLLQRLSQRLSLFTEGPRDLTPRQQTLRGAIDWSYDLLDEEERYLFTCVAVFRGGCTLEAVESMVNGQLASWESKLYALVDKSMLRYDLAANGDGRFWMLETIREYGLERLAADGWEATTRQAHAAYFLALAEQGEQALLGREQAAWLERLEQEHDNLRATLEWAVSRPENREVAVRLTGALWRFWQLHGHTSEGRRWLEQVVQYGEEVAPSPYWAKAIFGAGSLAAFQGDHAAAYFYYEQSLALWRALDDKHGIALALNGLAGLAYFGEGDLDKAVRLFQESLALRREIGDRWAVALSLNNLGVIEINRGRFKEAHALHAESLALRHELGDEWGIAQSLGNLGTTYYFLDRSRAGLFFEQSLVIQRKLGIRMGIVDSLNGLGDVALAEGRLSDAAAFYGESLSLSLEKENTMVSGKVIERLASLALAQGQPLWAARLFGAAESLLAHVNPATHPAERPHYASIHAALESELDKTSLDAALAAGHALSLEELIKLASALDGVKREA